jgi:hypothetical protein
MPQALLLDRPPSIIGAGSEGPAPPGAGRMEQLIHPLRFLCAGSWQVRGTFEQWVREPLPGRGYSIAEAVRFEDDEFDGIRLELTNIGIAIRFTPKANAYLMGLPLTGKLARRLEEKRRAEEARDAERQEWMQRAADARGARILSEARIELRDEGDAWATTPNDAPDGRSPMDAARESAAELASASKLLDALLRHRSNEVRKAQVAEETWDELRREAAKAFCGQHLDIYLKAGHPALGGKSPSADCVDEASMRRCMELALGAGKRRR